MHKKQTIKGSVLDTKETEADNATLAYSVTAE